MSDQPTTPPESDELRELRSQLVQFREHIDPDDPQHTHHAAMIALRFGERHAELLEHMVTRMVGLHNRLTRLENALAAALGHES